MKNAPRSSWAGLFPPGQAPAQRDSSEMPRNTWAPMFAQPNQKRAAADAMLAKLDGLQRAIIHLRRGEALPSDCALWLADGFERFINEGGDLGDRLGLGVRRGGRFHTIANLNALKRRDQLVLILIDEIPLGDLSERIKAVDAFLRDRGPDPANGFGAALKRMLKEMDAPIPGKRRLRQIVEMKSAYGCNQ